MTVMSAGSDKSKSASHARSCTTSLTAFTNFDCILYQHALISIKYAYEVERFVILLPSNNQRTKLSLDF